MASTIGIQALFQGDFAPAKIADHDDVLNEERVITGIDPVTNVRLDLLQYVSLLEKYKEKNPRLVLNVARVAAGAMWSLLAQKNGERAALFCVEGCRWGVGQRTGAEIHAHMYKALQMGRDDAALPDPIIDPCSNRTVVEIDRGYSHALTADATELIGITHGYHRKRSQRIADQLRKDVAEETAQSTEALPPIHILTPEHLLEERMRHGKLELIDWFLGDVIQAAAPSAGVNRKEWIREVAIVRPIAATSRLLKRLTGFDLEARIADWKRAEAQE